MGVNYLGRPSAVVATALSMSLILYKCFCTNGKDIFQLTNDFTDIFVLLFDYER